MHELDAGGIVVQLHFPPGGGRLLAAVREGHSDVHFEVLALPDGAPRVRLDLPPLRLADWHYSGYGAAVAFDPDGEVAYIAWGGGLHACRLADGARLAMPEGVEANQVVLSPDGCAMLAARTDLGATLELTRLHRAGTGWVVAGPEPTASPVRQVAGFLPDGERYIVVDQKVRLRTLAGPDDLATARYPTYNIHQPRLSPDGRLLGVIGYSSMYVYDLPGLGTPRRIASSSNSGNFRSFAFHPTDGTIAVIHGGPTLVKVYDAASLELRHKLSWRLGPLDAVAFSPDGMLGAAGGERGRIVLWDA